MSRKYIGAFKSGTITISFGKLPLKLQMNVPAEPLKPQRMLPIFQKLTNSFVDLTVQAEEKLGRKISCKAGCGACCSQPVPISEVEAYDLAELISEMPAEDRVKFEKRFSDAMNHFREIGWFDRLENVASTAKKDRTAAADDLQILVEEYFNQNIPCPFLEKGSCSIHPDRPLACREYLVTSPAEECSKPWDGKVVGINLPLQPSRMIRNLGGKRRTEIGFIPLIMALEIAKTPESFVMKEGESWLKDFFSPIPKTRRLQKKRTNTSRKR